MDDQVEIDIYHSDKILYQLELACTEDKVKKTSEIEIRDEVLNEAKLDEIDAELSDLISEQFKITSDCTDVKSVLEEEESKFDSKKWSRKYAKLKKRIQNLGILALEAELTGLQIFFEDNCSENYLQRLLFNKIVDRNLEEKQKDKDFVEPLLGDYETLGRYLICIDFEATCDNRPSLAHNLQEIIEFPAIAIDTHTNTIISQFHSYVRPKYNPKLTAYCKKLTGISQAAIKRSPSFPRVLNKFLYWVDCLTAEILPAESVVTFVSHGPYDFNQFLQINCQLHGFSVPNIFYMANYKFIDMQKTASQIIKALLRTEPDINGVPSHNFDLTMPNLITPSLVTIADIFGVKYKGNAHSGWVDTYVIAELIIKWRSLGYRIYSNNNYKFVDYSEKFKNLLLNRI